MKNVGATKINIKENHKATHSKPKRVSKKVETKHKSKKISFIELLLHLFLGLEVDNNE